MMGDRLVLDSVIGNAVSHYLHNLLFWAGQAELFAWEGATTVQAEMYRGHTIEGMDTVFARGVCANGIEVQVAATHACVGEHLNREWIECERATIRREGWEAWHIVWKDGRQEEVPIAQRDQLSDNFQAYFRYLRGESPRPVSRLEDTRPFVEFYDLTYLAANEITTVPDEHLLRSQAEDGRGEYVAISGIRDVCEAFIATGRFPAEQGIAWARPGGQAAREALPLLRAAIEHMSAQRARETQAPGGDG